MDNNALALAVKPPSIDVATPLMQAAQLRRADVQSRAAEMQMKLDALGAEARGLAVYAGTPEFGQRWTEMADRLRSQGVISQEAYARWRDTPSPLVLRQLIAMTETPQMGLQRELTSPSHLAAVEEAKLKVQEKYSPKTTNIKTPGGEEITVTKGPGGFELPKIAGMDAATQTTTPIPPGVSPKIYREQLARKKADIAVEQPQAELALRTAISQLGQLKTAAQAIKNNPALWRVTGILGMAPDLPGSAAADLRGAIETLKTQVGFNVLQSMRDMSKTGGAIGQVTEKEHVMLQSALAPLQKPLSTEAMRKSLDNIIKYVDDATARLSDAYRKTYSKPGGDIQTPQTTAQPVKVKTPEEARKLPSGTPIMLPDGTIGRVP